MLEARRPLEKISAEINGPVERYAYVPSACRIGIAEEGNAKEAYIQYYREVNNQIITVRDVGLCVPNWNKSIGASPDGIVFNPTALIPHVLEIKCLVDKSPLPRTIVEIAKSRGSSFYCHVDPAGELHLKKNHSYYYQVLGEMAATGLWITDFVIYSPRTKEIKVLRIPFDPEEWEKVKVKVEKFAEKYL